MELCTEDINRIKEYQKEKGLNPLSESKSFATTIESKSPKFGNLPDNFIRMFVDFYKEATDSELDFITAAAIQTVSIALEKNVGINFGNGVEYPLIWQTLLAESGSIRKSTALNLTKTVMSNCGMKQNISADMSSPETLYEVMEKTPTQIMIVGEMSSLLSSFEKNYMRGAKEQFIDIFGLPQQFVKQRKDSKGNLKITTINDPYISIWGASVEETFMQYLKETDLLGGFLPRFLFVNCETRTRAYNPLPKKHDVISEELKQEFSKLRQIKGVVDLDRNSEAYNLYLQFFNEIMDFTTKEMPQILNSFASRYAVYTLKMALIMEACFLAKEDKKNLNEIRFESMQYAVAFMRVYWETAKTLTLDGKFTFTDFERNNNKIMNFLKRNNGITTQRDLLRKMNMTVKDLEPILDTMEKAEKIIRLEEPTKGKPKNVIKLL